MCYNFHLNVTFVKGNQMNQRTIKKSVEVVGILEAIKYILISVSDKIE